MALPVTNNAEGGTNTTGVTTANSGGASGTAWDATDISGTGGAITFDNTHAAHGSLAYKVVVSNPAATERLRWTTAVGSFTEIWGRVYLYRTANPTSSHQFVRINNASQTRQAYLIITASGNLGVSDSLNGQATTVSTITLNAWVRIEWHFLGNATTGSIEARLFNTSDSTSATDTVSRTNVNTDSGSGASQVDFGSGTAVNASDTYWMDDMAVNATGWPGPAVTTMSKSYVMPWEALGASVGNVLGNIATTTSVPQVWQSNSPPTANDDAADGVAIGDVWIDTTAQAGYWCVSSATGAAVWKKVTA